MTIHETRTELTPAEVIELARSFFAHAGTPYAAFPEVVGDNYLKLHMEVGEVVIAVVERDGSNWIRGTASRGEHLLSRFLTTLAPPLDVSETINRSRRKETRAAQVETAAVRAPEPAGLATPRPAQAA